MGNEPPRPQAPKPTIDDAILDMRMAAKRFAMESRRCEKEKDQLMAKAKQAMQKNNEEGAKLFLTSAMNKQKEADNLQKMSHKMDYMQGIIKNNANQTKTMDVLARISPLLNQQVQNMPLEQVYLNMNQFEAAMDEIQVQGKVMDGMMNKNVDAGQDLALDQMMGQLKQEMHNQVLINNNQVAQDLNANPNVLFNELNQQNQNQNAPQLNNNQIK